MQLALSGVGSNLTNTSKMSEHIHNIMVYSELLWSKHVMYIIISHSMVVLCDMIFYLLVQVTAVNLVTQPNLDDFLFTCPSYSSEPSNPAKS